MIYAPEGEREEGREGGKYSVGERKGRRGGGGG